MNQLVIDAARLANALTDKYSAERTEVARRWTKAKGTHCNRVARLMHKATRRYERRAIKAGLRPNWVDGLQ